MPSKQHYLVGLDLGSRGTRCIVALEEDSRLRFISCGVAPVAPEGWDKGVISDQDPVLQSVEAAIEEAEQNGGLLVESAVVGVGGTHVRSNVSHSSTPINSWEEIEKRHIDEAVKLAAQGVLSEDRTVLQAAPLEFSVDRQPPVRNPLGMKGRRLDAHVQVVSALAQAHDNIRAVVNRAGVVVEETISEAFAAAFCALEEQEREMGVAVIDLGAQTADLAVYTENDLRLVGAVAVAGDLFANDVATVLKTPREDAQQLIEQYGCVLPEQTAPNAMIETPGLLDGPSRQAPRRLLNEILRARAEELFELLREEVDRAGLRERLISGVVLTGGLACLAGACDVAEDRFETSVRIGLPPRLEDLPEELDHPGWAVPIGLVLYAQRLRLHQKRRSDRVAEWLKTLFD